MSFLAWLKRLFAGPTRDVSRLDEDLDVVEERVDVSGAPLKDHHQRRALRDKRLLPKTRAQRRTALGLGKRKKVMEKEEADRLFGGTLRTGNRGLRDLATDEEQLRRYGLPVWRTDEDVARALDIPRKELWFFAMHREKDEAPHYVTFSIPKRSGGKRLIMAPKRRLKAIQRKLLKLLVVKMPVSDEAHAFRRGRNIRTGAAPHVGKAVVLRIDLKDFFPSVTYRRVRGMLIAYGYGYPVAATLAVLMTEAERQPVEVAGTLFHVPVGPRHCVQGAPTSPGLCNTIVLRLDRRLSGLAKKHGLSYTRYADDLCFSGGLDREAVQRFRAAATRIVQDEGFEVNAGKTRVMGRGARQVVTGVVVNKDLGLSRRERRRLRAAAHRLEQQHQSGSVDESFGRWLRGRLAYLQMLNPAQAEALRPPSLR